jgi:hypothetical protein
MAVEKYVARAPAQVAAAHNESSPFTIEVRFLGGLTPRQMDAFTAAADRWCKVIIGDMPTVVVGGEVIDDLVILAQGQDIDGPGQILGQAGPTHLRPRSAGKAAFIPARGKMAFDTADLVQMEQSGTLNDVITHEMGHVLGIGTIWSRKRQLRGGGSANPTFTGETAEREYGTLTGGKARPVPVENKGGQGTADSHWREAVFGNELMTGFVGRAGNPISRLTVACLRDLGYVVDFDAAEPYELPNLLDLAEGPSLVSPDAHLRKGLMLPSIPLELPDESLNVR